MKAGSRSSAKTNKYAAAHSGWRKTPNPYPSDRPEARDRSGLVVAVAPHRTSGCSRTSDMALRAEEKRTQGHLFAFIDLLFLVVAFFILVLFFVRDRQVEAVAAMEKVQEKLAAAGEERTSF